MTFNKGEYGSNLYINLGTDISSGTLYTILLEPQRGDLKTFTTNITISSANVDVDDETYLGNQYLIYVVQADDLNKAGQWRVRGSSLVSGVLVKSDYVKFIVLP